MPRGYPRRKNEALHEDIDTEVENTIIDRLAVVRERLNEITAHREAGVLSVVEKIEARTLAIIEARFMRMLDIIEG